MDSGRITARQEAPPSQNENAADERSGRDRRGSNRRAPKRPFDPLFAATLVNHVAAVGVDYTRGYPAPASPPRGLVVNIRA